MDVEVLKGRYSFHCVSPLIVSGMIGVFLAFLKSTVISFVFPMLRSRLFKVDHSVMLWISSLYADSSLFLISPMMAVSFSNFIIVVMLWEAEQSFVYRVEKERAEDATLGATGAVGESGGCRCVPPHCLVPVSKKIQNPHAGGVL